mmetsp:Transcript_9478/g.20886  ORF Transcript_9478/g.20886 Transcript_9478/m.20886 type:complete len:142 (-) Transcript_9478:453-878(-)
MSQNGAMTLAALRSQFTFRAFVGVFLVSVCYFSRAPLPFLSWCVFDCGVLDILAQSRLVRLQQPYVACRVGSIPGCSLAASALIFYQAMVVVVLGTARSKANGIRSSSDGGVSIVGRRLSVSLYRDCKVAPRALSCQVSGC